MIVSHQHRFIFLKTTKTAGTSVEIALSQYCGPDDIITEMAPEDEAIRQQAGFPGPQHLRVPLEHYARDDWIRLLRGRRAKYFNHIPAVRLRGWLPDDVWSDYFKFAIVRNPWDRAVSRYFWNRTSPEETFSAFVDRGGLRKNVEGGFPVYSIDGEVAVDHVIEFESLSNGLGEVARKVGLGDSLELPWAKSQYRDDRHYRELIDPAMRDRIARMFSEEIELFGYEF